MSQTKSWWENWPGNNIICCKGRIFAGPDWKTFAGSHFLILAPSGVFFAWSAPFLWLYVNPIIPIICAALLIWVTASLFIAGFIDPGIIPRVPKIPPGDAVFSDEPLSAYIPPVRPPPTQEVQLDGTFVFLKFCETCNIYRPPRASHCSTCNNCVERFDHHCPWTGTCVGLRNYRYFYSFVASTTIYAVVVFIFCLVHLILLSVTLGATDPSSSVAPFFRAIGAAPAPFVLVLYCFGILWAVGGLAVYHTHLICTGRTTNEDIKETYADSENPFNRGGRANCRATLCSENAPSLVSERFAYQPRLVRGPQPDALLSQSPAVLLASPDRKSVV